MFSTIPDADADNDDDNDDNDNYVHNNNDKFNIDKNWILYIVVWGFTYFKHLGLWDTIISPQHTANEMSTK